MTLFDFGDHRSLLIQSAKLTADPIRHDEIAGISRLSRLYRLNWRLKLWALVRKVCACQLLNQRTYPKRIYNCKNKRFSLVVVHLPPPSIFYLQAFLGILAAVVSLKKDDLENYINTCNELRVYSRIDFSSADFCEIWHIECIVLYKINLV